jgi:peptidoglycan/xylan/chitin deacetylase (PgdA/CDA1 family)
MIRFKLYSNIFLIILSFQPDLTYSQRRDRKHTVIDTHGAIIRGDTLRKEIALVFTGDQYADGGDVIKNVLHKNDVKASFFLTGNFYKTSGFLNLLHQLKNDGHYLGAHSDQHLLYADWENRDSLLVTENIFKQDLEKNYERMREFAITKRDARYFLPPYEWYNLSISTWTNELGLELINFSPGTLSAADYTYPEMKERYRSSDAIYQSVIDYEQKDPNGLNGFILLFHIGTDSRRTDKFYNRLDDLIRELHSKGYRFVRIDTLLDKKN